VITKTLHIAAKAETAITAVLQKLPPGADEAGNLKKIIMIKENAKMTNKLKAKDIKLANLVDAINEGNVDVIKFVAKRQPMAVIFLTGLTTEQRNVFKGFPDFFSIRRLEAAVCNANGVVDEGADEDEETTSTPAKKEKEKEAPVKKSAKKAAPASDDDNDDEDDFDEDEDEPAAKKAAKKSAPAKKSKKAKVEDDEDEDEDEDEDFDDFDEFE